VARFDYGDHHRYTPAEMRRLARCVKDLRSSGARSWLTLIFEKYLNGCAACPVLGDVNRLRAPTASPNWWRGNRDLFSGLHGPLAAQRAGCRRTLCRRRF